MTVHQEPPLGPAFGLDETGHDNDPRSSPSQRRPPLRPWTRKGHPLNTTVERESPEHRPLCPTSRQRLVMKKTEKIQPQRPDENNRIPTRRKLQLPEVAGGHPSVRKSRTLYSTRIQRVHWNGKDARLHDPPWSCNIQVLAHSYAIYNTPKKKNPHDNSSLPSHKRPCSSTIVCGTGGKEFFN